MSKHFLFVSDFDQTLSFNDSGHLLSDSLGLERWQLRSAIHAIKARADLGARDRVKIYDDGRVTDESCEDVGIIYDEI